VAEALIRANKRFDFFVFPGQRHGYGNMADYWFWLRAEYFAEHLLGARRTDADIEEINNERAREGGRGVNRNSGRSGTTGGTTTTTGGRGRRGGGGGR